jgi:spermidine/putrescine transport system substrate-binding protein
MPDDELKILVPESMRADLERRITRRQAVLAAGGGALALYLAGCGGSTGSKSESTPAGTADKPSVAADAQIEDELLISNWVDYSDPANYKAYTAEFGPKVTVSGYGSNDELLAKLRAGGSKFDIVAPTGYAVKTMIDQGLALPLNHELLPNIKNLLPSFTKLEYDPGNKYSVPKDYGITSFYWLTDKVSEKPATIKECFELLKTSALKDVRVNFLEGGTQVTALALKALGYSLNSEDEKELDEAKQLLLDVKPNIDTINSTFIERASKGDIDFGMGWNGDIRRAIKALEKKDQEMVFLVPEDSTEFWVDNWVIPEGAEHPVAAHKWLNFLLDPVNAGKEMDYHQYSVPVDGITDHVAEDLANDPLIMLPDETIARYETQLQTSKGLQQRERIYTEFKAA